MNTTNMNLTNKMLLALTFVSAAHGVECTKPTIPDKPKLHGAAGHCALPNLDKIDALWNILTKVSDREENKISMILREENAGNANPPHTLRITFVQNKKSWEEWLDIMYKERAKKVAEGYQCDHLDKDRAFKGAFRIGLYCESTTNGHKYKLHAFRSKHDSMSHLE